MRITSTPGLPDTLSTAATSEVAATAPASAPPASAPAAAELQSAVLQPALAALRELPDIDHARVAALRVALARGDLPFDADKLAGLIERFHGAHQ